MRFERLAERLQVRARELGDLIQKKDSAMRERNLSGFQVGAAARERIQRAGVVDLTEGAGGEWRCVS